MRSGPLDSSCPPPFRDAPRGYRATTARRYSPPTVRPGPWRPPSHGNRRGRPLSRRHAPGYRFARAFLQGECSGVWMKMVPALPPPRRRDLHGIGPDPARRSAPAHRAGAFVSAVSCCPQGRRTASRAAGAASDDRAAAGTLGPGVALVSLGFRHELHTRSIPSSSAWSGPQRCSLNRQRRRVIANHHPRNRRSVGTSVDQDAPACCRCRV